MAVEISTWADLQAINSALGGDFILMNDLGSGDTGYDTYASSTANGGNGWLSIGNLATPFTGIFNGDGFIISDIFIDRSGTDYQGLFGKTLGATVSNVGIVDCDITGNWYVGGLMGDCGVSSSVDKCYSTGTIVATGTEYAGGISGRVQTSTITDSYSIASVAGVDTIGGLAGRIRSSSTITNCYSTGSVSGSGIQDGGLIGQSSTTAIDSFWDTQTSGQATSATGTGKTTTEMQTQSTFTNWDFDDIWEINVSEYPTLQIFNSSPEPSTPTIQGINQITGVQSITL